MPEVIPPAPYKPGYRTTEFWIAVASNVTAIATALGYINPGDVKGVDQALQAIVTGLFSVAVNVVYIVGRVQAKSRR